jgi:hypothetical protein
MAKFLVDTTAQTEKALYHIVLVYSVYKDFSMFDLNLGWWFAGLHRKLQLGWAPMVNDWQFGLWV